ncbi:hypothetical protein [Rufibacter sp. XAAS-G3-1]|uniref:hypothetical protein n=1 Tax=Rufibacter sp. XAAS-G3-1 TaxID=2729134 RepID=UPI0015E69AF0|nr:hypothetical protein [Rufibacter sp. XAAS-G3-1]
MKANTTLRFVLLVLLVSTGASAQELSSPGLLERKFYIGFRLNTTSHTLLYNKQKEPSSGSFVAIPSLHLGCRLFRSTNIQIGISYGANSLNRGTESVNSNGDLLQYHEYSKTKAILFPITLQQFFF